MIILSGLKSCGSCKKALTWLNESGIQHTWRDVKKDGVDSQRLDHWLAKAGWETLLNRKGTTWRTLPEDKKTNLDETKARSLMVENMSIVKRPIWEFPDGRVMVGFDQTVQDEISKI